MDAPLTEPPNMILNPTVNPIARRPTEYAILHRAFYRRPNRVRLQVTVGPN
jgi:hypothetical protein